MSTRIYELPIEQTRWQTPSGGDVVFQWEYDVGRDKLLKLYDKGKRMQWNADVRIDWSHDPDPENPLGTPDINVPLYGTKMWEKMSDKERGEIRRHAAAWQFSQFLHGEQGALICTAKIVEGVPDLDSKFYAATQVMDEARHVEVFSRYLRDKLDLAYPVNPNLKTLLDQIIRRPEWDFAYLGMQILIEGLALAAFGLIRDFAQDPLARAVNAYVMQDEARHVAFGRLALRDYYPQISDAERDEREEFVVEACYLMRDRLLADEMWEHMGVKGDDLEHVKNSDNVRQFRRLLFSRIVPALRDIGLWGTRVQRAFDDMGVLPFANVDVDALSARDEQVAEQFDQERAAQAEHVAAVIKETE